MKRLKAKSFYELGIAAYYYIFTGIDFYSYSNVNYNSVRASLLFKFKGTNRHTNNK